MSRTRAAVVAALSFTALVVALTGAANPTDGDSGWGSVQADDSGWGRSLTSAEAAPAEPRV
ncbi:hypothetical protein [Streptomyces bicolor]|uniref:hypothetical protein n=1 Tax=Streptomyces bicolor TaxID=66874 RepID=UPI0004E0C16A|nr:hypothetical protein [Streptomyces bicolor]